MSTDDIKHIGRQLDAFCMAWRYIGGTFRSDGQTLEYREPFENARYCLDYADALPRKGS